MQAVKDDHPGVHIPPPLLYAGSFLLSLFLQRLIPLPTEFVDKSLAYWIGSGLIGIMLVVIVPALLTFLRSRNTLIPNKAAHSLQMGGIYAFSRNPMYLGLLTGYIGLSLLVGNSWSLLLVPVLGLVVDRYVIKREEQYLERAFGNAYRAYKQQVRRWL